jgi:orotidine-5'-phosphate decarboxylase
MLKPAERLIVAADFKPSVPAVEKQSWCANDQGSLRPEARFEIREKVIALANKLKNTGVYLKVNSALRACGYDLIDDIHARGLKVFADLKLFDIGETLATDGELLKKAKPELLTTVCVAGNLALRALKQVLPDTEVLGVTVLTSLKDTDTQAMFGCSVEEAVMRFAQVAADAGIDGLISSPKEVGMLRKRFGDTLSLNTPAIRLLWSIVPGDDQNPDRIMTPATAIKAGADRIVVGRPITRPPQGMSSYDAVMRTIEEIESAMR